jgi:drug/metabolite transporter (DMT)-like permease
MTKKDLCGTAFILASVVLISLGGSNQNSEKIEEIYLIVAIIMALAAGLVLSLNSVQIQYCIT